jgi:WD40 repeat protein
VLEQAGSSTSRVLDENHAFIKGALSADGGRVVFISKNDNVCVWDMEGHTPPRVLQGQANWKTAVALSANGSRTVFGCHDGTLQVCDLEGDAPPRVLEGHTDPVTAVALSADGSRAVSGSRDRTLHIWA